MKTAIPFMRRGALPLFWTIRTLLSRTSEIPWSRRGKCDADAVRFIVERGRRAIQKLVDAGLNSAVKRIPTVIGLSLDQRRGHSHRRVIHEQMPRAERWPRLS